MEREATLAPIAKPNFIAFSTAPLFKTGRVPGKAKSTTQACVLGSAPKSVEAAEKIFVLVES